jgi:transposase
LEARPAYPQCEHALDCIGALYEIERQLPRYQGLDPPERAAALALRTRQRQQQSVPILRELGQWAEQQEALPQSSLRKAIVYMQSLWPGLVRFAADGRLPLDNNAIERDLRGVVVGRKNHYGSRSERGTQVAAVLYSLIETAKHFGVPEHVYLRKATEHALRNPGSSLLPHQLLG